MFLTNISLLKLFDFFNQSKVIALLFFLYRFSKIEKVSIFIIINIGLFVLFLNDLEAQITLAFPGAEGFGKYSLGGRGGEIFKVTSLNDNGPGSLREAIEAEGPRIVIFEVGGIIDLETELTIWNPYITIAGQTAPGQGICIRGNSLRIRTHDIIIRFLRIRPGDIDFGMRNDWSDLDAIGISDGQTRVYNIIIDHCSLSWAVDEVVGIWGSPYNITIQNSIISEGLHRSKHPKGPHSRGILVGSKADSISIINNLIMHNSERNPQFSNAGYGDFRNNIVYNPKDYAVMISNWPNPKQFINFVGNVFIPGNDTNFEHEISVWDSERYNGIIYLKDNIGFNERVTRDNILMLEDWHSREPLSKDEIVLITSDNEFINYVSYTKTHKEMFDFVNKYIGASLPRRDVVDKRLIYELDIRTGKIIDSQNEVGGWPGFNSRFSQISNNEIGGNISTTSSGIPLEWMEKYNILPGQENLDFNNNGYTNIEEYLNGTDPRSYIEPNALSVFNAFSFFRLSEDENSKLEVMPNPFMEYTRIWFSIDARTKVVINIYNSMGQIVSQLVNAELFPGDYEFIWVPEWHNSGIYIANMKINGKNMGSKKLLLYN